MANFFQDTWNGIKKTGSAVGSAIVDAAINTDVNGAANAFSNTVKDQLNAVVDRTITNKSTDLMEVALGVSVAGYCDFNTKMRTYMERLMKINVDQLSKTLGNTGTSAYMYGDSATISNEVKSYSYAKGTNYIDSFAKNAMIDRKGKSDSTVTKTEFTKEYPYEERTNLYPDDLAQGHSNFRQWEKWNTQNKNSILYKTKKLFQQGKINTIISRFGTKADGSSHGVDYIGSIRTKYGESRGRNLLKAEAEDYRVLNWSYAVNGYNNPYCRVWTHHHQYNYWARTMRPFTSETISQAGDGIFSASMVSPGEFHKWPTFQKESSNSAYRTYKGGNEGREYSVLDTSRGGDGLVKITPKYQGGESKNIHAKDCMFSIENLAWRGYDPYAFEDALSWEQRGPLGGRIMWFPPYGIQFSESTSVKWSSNTFIGRGEDVYTYINTSRAGTLSFLMVVDHPSIINYAMWTDKLGHADETDLLRFFAGCDSLDPSDTHSIMSKIQPTPLTDEWIKNDVDDPDDVIYQTRRNTDQGAIYAYSGESKVLLDKYVALFFPNNFTGKDAEDNDSKLLQVLYYLMAGKGTGYFGNTYKSTVHEPPALTGYDMLFTQIKTDRVDGSIEEHYGYQMKHNNLTQDDKGISDESDYRVGVGGGKFYIWVDDAKIKNTLHIIGDEKYNKKLAGGDWVTFGVNENLSNNSKFAIKINDSQTIPSSEILTFYEILEMWSGDYKVGEGGLNLNSNTERVEITPLAGFESWYSTDRANYPLPTYRLNTLTNALNKIFSQIKTDPDKQIYVTENPQKDTYRWMYENKATDTEQILKVSPHNSLAAILNRSAICQIKCYSKGDKKYYLTSASSRSVQENVMKGYEVTVEDVISKIYYEVALPSVIGGNDNAVMWELKPINDIIVSLMSAWPLNEYTDKVNEIVFGKNDDFVVNGNRITSIRINNSECYLIIDPEKENDISATQTEDKLFWYQTTTTTIKADNGNDTTVPCIQICAPIPVTIGVVNDMVSHTVYSDGSTHTVVVGDTTINYTYYTDNTTFCIYNNNELIYTVGSNYQIIDDSQTNIEPHVYFLKILSGDLGKGERTLMSDSQYTYTICTKNYKKSNGVLLTDKEYDELSAEEKPNYTELKGEDSVLIIRRLPKTRNNISGNTNESVNNTETNTIIPRTTNQVGLLSDSSVEEVDFRWLLRLFAHTFEFSENSVYGMWSFVEDYYSYNDINIVKEWFEENETEFYPDVESIEKDPVSGFIIRMKDYNYIVKTVDDYEFCLDSIKVSRTHSNDAAYYTLQYVMRCNNDTSTTDKLTDSIAKLKTLCETYKTTGLSTDVKHSGDSYYVTFKITCQWISDKIFNGTKPVQNLCLVLLTNLASDVEKNFTYIPYYDVSVDNNKILIIDDIDIIGLSIFLGSDNKKIYYNGGWHSVSLTKSDKYVLELSDNGGSGGDSDDTPSGDAVSMTALDFLKKCFKKETCDGKDIFLPVYIRCQYGGFDEMFNIDSSKVTMAEGQYGGKCYTINDNSFVLTRGDDTIVINKFDFYTFSANNKDVGKAHIIFYTNNTKKLATALSYAMADNYFRGLNLSIDSSDDTVVLYVTCISSNFKDNQHKNDVVYLRDKEGNDCWGYATDKNLGKKNKCYLVEDNGLFGDKTSAQISDGVFFVKYTKDDKTYIQFQNKPPQTNDNEAKATGNSNSDSGTNGGKNPSNVKKDNNNGLSDSKSKDGDNKDDCVKKDEQSDKSDAKKKEAPRPLVDEDGQVLGDIKNIPPEPKAQQAVVSNKDDKPKDKPKDETPEPIMGDGPVTFNVNSQKLREKYKLDIEFFNKNFSYVKGNDQAAGKYNDNAFSMAPTAADAADTEDMKKLAEILENQPTLLGELFTLTINADGVVYKPSDVQCIKIASNKYAYVDTNNNFNCGIKFKVKDNSGNYVGSTDFNTKVKELQMYTDNTVYGSVIIYSQDEGSKSELAEVKVTGSRSGVRKTPIDRNNKCTFCVDESGRRHRNNEKNIYRYDQEYYFFKALQMTDKLAYTQLVEKIRYFDPAFHSMTPEGFNARLTFLNQCTRQGMTKSASDYNVQTANNMAFGRPPFCVLRIGDFYNQMIVIDSINIDYSVSDGIQWDMNTEGIGMQPLLARIDINFKFIGGGDIQGPIRRLQNAMTFNYYANTRFYDNRADRVKYGESTYDYKAMGAIDYSVNYNDSMSYVTKMRNKS